MSHRLTRMNTDKKSVFIRVNLWLKLLAVADEDEAAPVEWMARFGVL